MHLVMIGGSDAGISAALRARELDPAADVTVVLEDAYPNFSICGIPDYVSGEVAHWCWLSSGCGPTSPWPPRPGPSWASGARSRSTPGCARTCRTSTRPGTA